MASASAIHAFPHAVPSREELLARARAMIPVLKERGARWQA